MRHEGEITNFRSELGLIEDLRRSGRSTLIDNDQIKVLINGLSLTGRKIADIFQITRSSGFRTGMFYRIHHFPPNLRLSFCFLFKSYNNLILMKILRFLIEVYFLSSPVPLPGDMLPFSVDISKVS